MFLIQEKRTKGTYLAIVQSYRDPVTKKTKKKRIKNIGYLEDLEKIYHDPITHFKQVAKDMSEQQSIKAAPIYTSFNPTETLQLGENYSKNFGYAALSSLYYELKLDVFFRGRQRDLDVDYRLNRIMKLLVYGRILYPGSEMQIFSKKDRFFDKMDFTLNDIYDSFRHFRHYKSQLQKWLHKCIKENYGRDTSQMDYYVTNHYFEVADKDKDKDLRVDPVLQMGTFVDSNRLPVYYELFQRAPGDIPLLTPIFKKAKQEFGVKRIVVIADNGVNSADHLYRISASGNGYIVSQSIRNADKELQDFVLNQNDYISFGKELKMKSRLYNRKIRITMADGKKKNVTLKEKQIIFHNGVYERWAMAERENVLLMAKDLIASPGRYNRATAYSVSNYIKNLEYDKVSGEIMQDNRQLVLNEARLKDEEQFDGYYMIFTSEIDTDDIEIINRYSDIWEIEDSFRFVNKTFHARPDHISRSDHLAAHFLTCFVALTMTRILDMKVLRQYPTHQLITSMKKCNCVYVEDNYYMQTYYDPVLSLLGERLNVDYSKRYRSLCEIKESLNPINQNNK